MSSAPNPSVVFDLDGTLVDSEPNYFEAGRRLLAELGIHDFTWQDHERFVGISTRETLAQWRRTYALRPSLDELLARKNEHYLDLAGTGTRAYPQMLELVELLHRSGHPMIVASGSSRKAIEAILTGTGLEARISAYVSADEVAHGKPAPDVFLEAARRLGTAAVDCVVLEDAAPGVVAAHAAGMRCVAVPYVAQHADDPDFATAGLLFRGGQDAFSARTAYAWITGAAA